MKSSRPSTTRVEEHKIAYMRIVIIIHYSTGEVVVMQGPVRASANVRNSSLDARPGCR
jgi:hypothetical protein